MKRSRLARLLFICGFLPRNEEAATANHRGDKNDWQQRPGKIDMKNNQNSKQGYRKDIDHDNRTKAPTFEVAVIGFGDLEQDAYLLEELT